MRAITVRQPWAWAIIHGGKDIENRSRNIAGSYRGPVAIHAALNVDGGAVPMPRLVAHAIGVGRRATPGVSSRVAHPVGAPLTEGNAIATWYGNRGAIIGVVDLVGVHRSTLLAGCVPSNLRSIIGVQMCSDWGVRESVHLMLANPRPLPEPIPCRGALGLWTVPDHIVAQIEVAP